MPFFIIVICLYLLTVRKCDERVIQSTAGTYLIALMLVILAESLCPARLYLLCLKAVKVSNENEFHEIVHFLVKTAAHRPWGELL